MRHSKWIVLSNQEIALRTYQMVLEGDTRDILPGQFIEIAVPGYYLRRPFSVCNCDDHQLTIIYKVVGQGTAAMAAMVPNTEVDILVGLGHGYNLHKAGNSVLLVGGGAGVPPLMYAAKELLGMGKQVHCVLGFNSANEVFGEITLRAMGCKVEVCTMDGSYGKKGVVTDWISQPAPYYFACGPLPMLKALVRTIGTEGQISMEERMGCGVGICMGCSIETQQGVKRVCKEGPVFKAGDIIWK